jgi:hypothetical protein
MLRLVNQTIEASQIAARPLIDFVMQPAIGRQSYPDFF